LEGDCCAQPEPSEPAAELAIAAVFMKSLRSISIPVVKFRAT
jgi:hypothetical protein